MIHWTKQEAREYLLNYQFINSEYAKDIRHVFERLQTIQVDPLNVVGNNMELVLQSRLKQFQSKDLYHALYKERYIIDGWDRQMSIFLTEDFPKFQPVREERAKADLWIVKKYRGYDSTEYIDVVLQEIKTKGPLFSKDISFGEAVENRWGRNKPSSATLDYLFFLGRIGVFDRNKTQKQYDLIENLIDNYNDPFPFSNMEEFLDYYVLRRIKTSGLTWNKQIPFYGAYITDNKTRTNHIKRLLQQDKIVEIQVEGIKDILYAPKDALKIPIKIEDRISFLAPLDNAIWDRALLKLLFDFDYTWEVYTPVNKRKFGYYVLPIVWGSNIIGRIEFENYKGEGPFVVSNIWFEPNVKRTKRLEQKLTQAFKRFAKYLGTKSYQFDGNLIQL